MILIKQHTSIRTIILENESNNFLFILIIAYLILVIWKYQKDFACMSYAFCTIIFLCTNNYLPMKVKLNS